MVASWTMHGCWSYETVQWVCVLFLCVSHHVLFGIKCYFLPVSFVPSFLSLSVSVSLSSRFRYSIQSCSPRLFFVLFLSVFYPVPLFFGFHCFLLISSIFKLSHKLVFIQERQATRVICSFQTNISWTERTRHTSRTQQPDSVWCYISLLHCTAHYIIYLYLSI